MTSEAQAAEIPFSREEIFQVNRFFMDADQARRDVDDLFDPASIPKPKSGERRGRDSMLPDDGRKYLKFRVIPTVTFTDDYLILLSLLSAETSAKVARYRSARSPNGVIPRDIEKTWEERRAMFSAAPDIIKWLESLKRN